MKLIIQNTKPEYVREIDELAQKLNTHPLIKEGKITLSVELEEKKKSVKP